MPRRRIRFKSHHPHPAKPSTAATPAYANLHNSKYFPRFTALPSKHGLDLRYFILRGEYYVPKRHWCLLVEIVAIERFTRVLLRTRDRTGTPVVVAFYTDDRGARFNTSALKVGHTVAIMYAGRHAFLDGSSGVRVENREAVKVFPISLDNFLRLTDEVQRWPRDFAEHTTCHGCGAEGELKRCMRCGVLQYCNKECQEIGWKDKNHKKDCRIIADPDFQEMLMLQWSVFWNFKGFPMRNI